jgi:hypothetical protein
MASFVKLLYTSKNTLMKIPLVQLMAALALYSKAGYEYSSLSPSSFSLSPYLLAL